MATRITINQSLLTPIGQGRREFKGTRQEASDLLRGAAASLVSRGQVRSGYLRLTQDRDGLTLGTNLFKRTQSTDQARDVLRSMIKTAYGEHAGIEAAIDAYLGQSSQRLGTQSFVKLIQALDAQTGPIPDDPNTQVIAGAKPKQNARLQSETFGSAVELTRQQAHLAQEIDATRAMIEQQPLLEPAQILKLGAAIDEIAAERDQVSNALGGLTASPAVSTALSSLDDRLSDLRALHQEAVDRRASIEDCFERRDFEEAVAKFKDWAPNASAEQLARLALKSGFKLAAGPVEGWVGYARAAFTGQEATGHIAAFLAAAINPEAGWQLPPNGARDLAPGKGGQAARALSALRQVDPEQARAVTRAWIDNAPKGGEQTPGSGGVNFVTRTDPLYKLRTGTRDASASVTVIDLGLSAIDLKGVKLNDSTLLIRPADLGWFGAGFHWGVDLTASDLTGTHIELDLEAGFGKVIDTPDKLKENLTSVYRSILTNGYAGSPQGGGQGGVLGMIESIPARFPDQRIALTGQLLEFVHRHPPPTPWRVNTGFLLVSLSMLIERYPELQADERLSSILDQIREQHALQPAQMFDAYAGALLKQRPPNPLMVKLAIDTLAATRPADCDFHGLAKLADAIPEFGGDPRVRAMLQRSSEMPAAQAARVFEKCFAEKARGPAVLEIALSAWHAMSAEARESVCKDKSLTINLFLDHTDRIDTQQPGAEASRALARAIETVYFKTEPYAAIRKMVLGDYGDEESQIRVIAKINEAPHKSSILVMSPEIFRDIVSDPGAVRWEEVMVVRSGQGDMAALEFIPASELKTLLPRLVNPFPALRTAYATRPSNASAQAIDKIFASQSKDTIAAMVNVLNKGTNDRSMTPETLSDLLGSSLEPHFEDYKLVGAWKRWTEARLRPEHLGELLSLAKEEGMGENKTAFARYLFSMSASLLRLSSVVGLGTEESSVNALRFYAHGLLSEALRLQPELVGAENGTAFERGMWNTEQCGQILSESMSAAAKEFMPYSAKLILPPVMATWLLPNRNENAGLASEAIY